MARPTKFSPTYCEKLIKHCAKGFSFESFAHTIGVTGRTLRNWANTIPEFSEAYERARLAALYFFERQLLKGISGTAKGASKQNTTLLIFALKTRFSAMYGQKVQAEVNGTVEVEAPGTIEFRGKRVAISDIPIEELDEANREIEEQIKGVEARLERLRNEPDPLAEYENSF